MSCNGNPEDGLTVSNGFYVTRASNITLECYWKMNKLSVAL